MDAKKEFIIDCASQGLLDTATKTKIMNVIQCFFNAIPDLYKEDVNLRITYIDLNKMNEDGINKVYKIVRDRYDYLDSSN